MHKKSELKAVAAQRFSGKLINYVAIVSAIKTRINAENSYLFSETMDEGPMDQLLGHAGKLVTG